MPQPGETIRSMIFYVDPKGATSRDEVDLKYDSRLDSIHVKVTTENPLHGYEFVLPVASIRKAMGG